MGCPVELQNGEECDATKMLKELKLEKLKIYGEIASASPRK